MHLPQKKTVRPRACGFHGMLRDRLLRGLSLLPSGIRHAWHGAGGYAAG